MEIRNAILLILLGAPAVGLLLFGPSGTKPVPAGRTVVRYWEKWTGVEGEAVQRIVDRFNQTVGADRGIWVDYHALGDVDKRMLIATAGGAPPDLAGLYDRFVPQYAEHGALLSLDELAVESGIDLGAFKPIWLQICGYDGKLFALPSTPYTIGLYYNRRLFREAGLDPDHPPQTTTELDEFTRRLTRYENNDSVRGRIVQLGFTVSPSMLGWWHWVWPYFFGGSLWDGERFTLDVPETHAAMESIMAVRREIGNERVLQFEGQSAAIESAQNPFLAGTLAMVFQGPWMSNWARVYAPDLDYAVARFPSVTREMKRVFASTDVFVIPKGSRHPREAMVFLAYMLSQPVLEELCQAHGKTSPFTEPGTNFFADHPNPWIRVFDDLSRSPDAFGYPPMPVFSEAWTETLYMLETVLREAQPIDRAIRATQVKIDAVLGQHQEMVRRRAGAADR